MPISGGAVEQNLDVPVAEVALAIRKSGRVTGALPRISGTCTMRRNGAFVGSAACSSAGRRSTATRTPSDAEPLAIDVSQSVQRAGPEHQPSADDTFIDGSIAAEVPEVAGAVEKAARPGRFGTHHSNGH